MNCLKLLICIIIFSSITAAQWKIGGSWNLHSEVPTQGVGVFIEKKFPFQFPSFGVSARLGLDYHQKDKTENISIYFLPMVSFYITPYIYPYAGLGFGRDYYQTFGTDWNYFISLNAGFESEILSFLSIFIDGSFNKFLSHFTHVSLPTNHFRGSAGIMFKL